MMDELIYQEKITSKRTLALFLMLMTVFCLLGLWGVSLGGLKALAIVSFSLSVIFLFYSVNYRTLIIRMTPRSLQLKFGIFTWTVAFDNIEAYNLDEIPAFLRMGGAGIHFMIIRKHYRVSFNPGVPPGCNCT